MKNKFLAVILTVMATATITLNSAQIITNNEAQPQKDNQSTEEGTAYEGGISTFGHFPLADNG